MDFALILNLPEDVAHLQMVRRVSRDVLSSFNVAVQDIDDTETLLGELASNAVRHAHDGTYNVELSLIADLLTVTVSDKGAGFARSTVAAPGTTRADENGAMERIGGWGLPLVEMLADRVEYIPNNPHGTIVRAEKRVRHDNQVLQACGQSPVASSST